MTRLPDRCRPTADRRPWLPGRKADGRSRSRAVGAPRARFVFRRRSFPALDRSGIVSAMQRRGEVRHWPFESKYLRDFEVVEERRDGYRLFPHTEQLPLLSKAINHEFATGLTARLAKTDAR